MKIVVLLCALVMPAVAWMSQRGLLGPTNGAVSDRYPTLLVAAGYAFSIWGLIFLLDVVFGVWQMRRHPADHEAVLRRVRPFVALGFVCTAAWMVVFSQQWFWPALAVMLVALGCLVRCAIVLSRAPAGGMLTGLAWLPLSLHAGWLSMATFLNIAQVIVAFGLLPTENMLPWSAALLAIAAGLLLALNARMHGNLAYVAAAVWGLAGVYVKQSAAPLPGAAEAGWIAAVIAAALLLQTAWLLQRRRRGFTPLSAAR